MEKPHQPRSRNEFEIALICALTTESDALENLFDGFWEEDVSYGKAPGDKNAYTLGYIAGFNVVLAHMPGMGTAAASAVAASFLSSFPNIKLGLVVGICGGAPKSSEDQDILLGDVIVSTGVIQYTFGRQLPDKIARKDTLEDNLGRPNSEIRAFINKVKGRRSSQTLIEEAWTYLRKTQEDEKDQGANYPGSAEDKLYESSYTHKHQDRTECSVCAEWTKVEDAVCTSSSESNCVELGCSDQFLVTRERKKGLSGPKLARLFDLPEGLRPTVFFGRIASGDLVMKSGIRRDAITARDKTIAFEMEGAGVWESFPTLVIKGVCDYADSHKNKSWQKYAAASAAAYTKAILTKWRKSDPARALIQRFRMIPTNAVSKFVGRIELLEHIDYSIFGETNDANRPRVLVLHAMGGQGKTQLALQACKRAEETHEGIFWVDATSQDTAELAFESIAGEINNTSRELGDMKAKLKFVIEFLQTWDRRWLLVLDNYDQVEKFPNIRHFMPSSRYGTIIITSRHNGAIRLGKLIDIPSMIEDSGEELLLYQFWNRQGTSQEDQKATEIVKRLGGLALALDQAASYINYNRMLLSEFLSKYESKRSRILKHRPELFEYHLNSQVPVSAFTTWEMSFDQIDLRDEKYKEYIEKFLQVSACLDPRNIAEEIFAAHQQSSNDFFDWQRIFTPETGNESDSGSESDGSVGTQSQNWSSSSFQKLVARLYRISLLQNVQRTEDRSWISFSIHPVIRDWLQKREQDTEKQKVTARQCIELLVAAIEPGSVASSSPNQRRWLVEHLDACILAAKSAKLVPALGTTGMHEESREISSFFEDEGQYSKSQVILEQLVEDEKTSLQMDDEARLISMSELASTYRYQGRWKEAEMLDTQVLEMRKRVLGEEHPDTLTSMTNLASTYWSQGRWKEAETLDMQALEIEKRVLGEEHPNTLTSMNNLALTYMSQGRWKEVEVLEEKVLETRKRVLGEEHPNTLTSMNNLASIYWSQERWKEAEILEEQVLETRKRILGEEHPNTLTGMLNMAYTLKSLERKKEALELAESVYLSRARLLGPDHPDSQNACKVLSEWKRCAETPKED